jgi:hypothetical protein
MKFGTVCLLLGIALSAANAAANADDKASPAMSQRFESLKKLAGDWVKISKDGKPTDEVVSSIRVTAAGSTVQEALFPGSAHEMVTMYHLDGPDLVLTHYCMLGNQPRMRAEAGADDKKLVFNFVGGTNLKSKNEQHMDRATLTFHGKDHFEAEWVSCKDGKPCHQVSFDLVRKQ